MRRLHHAACRALLPLCSSLLCVPLACAEESPGTALPGRAADDLHGGRYGAVSIETDDPALQPAARRWVRDLRAGEAIDENALQRRLQLLKALPGVNSQSVLATREDGARDLRLKLERGPRYSGLVGVDNHGSRFTGDQRVRFGLEVPSLWTLGDSLSVSGNRRWHGTWNLNLGYTLPLGTDGWSLHAEVERSYYQLHRERRSLGASGTSDVLLLELAYPLWLGDAGSLYASVGLERTHADDRARPRTKPALKEHREMDMAPLKLTLKHAHGGHKTSGQLMWGLGRLKLDHALGTEDRNTARAEGRYQLFSADLRHERALAKDWTLFGRLAGQKASRNLDSEKWFAASGPQRIRAWTSAEAQGDEGWLLQLELQHRMGQAQPFVFADFGQVKLRHRPWHRSGNNWRSLAGAGPGLRWNADTWSAQAAVAWRTGGHRPHSRLGYRNPRIWLAATYRF
ncbi:ShlB/FhaC/HecB family hemolysin secretion/activation protein [Comamonas antarctica]|uniref:ShlB/FhaC/HecB family hemolysin secretion/activation protein n=1 Tax=Comamonas antarctica TaxID=2743470 RepID=A0A6N1XAM5_9BURK|nr:ShlB/FhaC/HecB family hemolysin secretion/activation protein [Comamonas antarctica]QKV54766.1 ShlB/FhaC/HecB family hemolysin secretion/activation protein [Comamonas antarctica]